MLSLKSHSLRIINPDNSHLKLMKSFSKIYIILYSLPLMLLFPSCAKKGFKTSYKIPASVNEYVVDGIKVLHKRTENDIVSIQILVKNNNPGKGKYIPGIAQLSLFSGLRSGTHNYPADSLAKIMDDNDLIIKPVASDNIYGISLKCTDKNWEDNWYILADLIKNPAFDENDFEAVKQDLLQTTAYLLKEPEVCLKENAIQQMAKKTELNIENNLDTSAIKNLTLNTVENYYQSLWTKQNIIIVVVGNIDFKASLERKMASTLNSLPEGDEIAATPKHIEIEETSYENLKKPANEVYVGGLMEAPANKGYETAAYQLGLYLLGKRLNEHFSTEQNNSNISVNLIQGQPPFAFIYSNGTDPVAFIKEVKKQINFIRMKGFSSRELRGYREIFLTNHYIDLQTNDAQGLALGEAELLGSWKNEEAFFNMINAVTLDDLNKIFDSYSEHIQWYYIGTDENLNKQLAQDIN